MGATSSRRIVRSLTKVAVAVLIVLGVASLPSSAAESEVYPGLPAFAVAVSPKATAINEVSTAKQWVRLPPLYTIGWSAPILPLDDTSCRRFPPYQRVQDFQAGLFFISTNADAPEPFGYVGPFTARTVAFGSIPVEAEVLIGQPRDAENLPIGYELNQRQAVYCLGRSPHSPTASETHIQAATMAAPVDISIVGLRVDGIDLRLRPGCVPSEQSVMDLSSREYFDLDPDLGVVPTDDGSTLMTTPYFSTPLGGLLTGSLDIAPFSGCVTKSGEDVSRLLTATVSGTGNAVQVRSQGLKLQGLECARDRDDCTNPLPGIDIPPEAETR